MQMGSTDLADTGEHSHKVFVRLCAGAFLFITILSLIRHHTFHSALYDLGIFHQVLWNTARGLPFASSIKHMNYLGDHFSPSLALLAPLEWLPYPMEWMLAAQALAEVLIAWNIFLLARRHLNERLSLLIGIGTLFCPPLFVSTLSDFHPEMFMAAALARGLYDLDCDRPLHGALWFLLMLGGKEDAAMVLLPLGLVLATESRYRVFGLVLAVVAAVWMALALKVFMPAFRPPAQPGAAWFYLGRYAHLGGSVSEVFRSLLFHPLRSLGASLTLLKALTILLIFGSWGFASLFGGLRAAAALPLAGAHFLSMREEQFGFGFHYLVTVMPVLAWAAIFGAPRILDRRPRLTRFLIGVVTVVSVIQRFDYSQHHRWPHHSALREAVSLIPPDAPVCVQNWFGAHLSGRPFIEFCSLWKIEKAQYQYYGWPEFSSATWQIFDLNIYEEQFPRIRARMHALREAGAVVVMDRDGVSVLRVDEAVLQRATVK